MMLERSASDRTRCIVGLSSVLLPMIPLTFAYARHATLTALTSGKLNPLMDYMLPGLVFLTLAAIVLALILYRLYAAGSDWLISQSARVKLENVAIALSLWIAAISFSLLAGTSYAYLVEDYFPLEPYYPMVVAYGLALTMLLAGVILLTIISASSTQRNPQRAGEGLSTWLSK